MCIPPRDSLVLALLIAPFLLLGIPASLSAQFLPVPTTIDDFFQPGTQPLTVQDTVIAGTACTLCHAYFPAQNSPYERDRKSTRLNSSHSQQSRMPSSA